MSKRCFRRSRRRMDHTAARATEPTPRGHRGWLGTTIYARPTPSFAKRPGRRVAPGAIARRRAPAARLQSFPRRLLVLGAKRFRSPRMGPRRAHLELFHQNWRLFQKRLFRSLFGAQKTKFNRKKHRGLFSHSARATLGAGLLLRVLRGPRWSNRLSVRRYGLTRAQRGVRQLSRLHPGKNHLLIRVEALFDSVFCLHDAWIRQTSRRMVSGGPDMDANRRRFARIGEFIPPHAPRSLHPRRAQSADRISRGVLLIACRQAQPCNPAHF